MVRRAARDHLTACLDTAAAIGAGLVVGAVAGTGGRSVMSQDDRERRIGLASEELRRVAARSGSTGVKIAVEPLNRYENNLINTIADGKALVELTNDRNIGLHIDLFHANIEEQDFGTAIRLAGAKLLHCHAVDNTRGAPGTGHLPWGDIFTALDDVSYDGALVIETFNPHNPDWATASSSWRPLAQSQDELVRVGLAFLSSMAETRSVAWNGKPPTSASR